MSEQRVAENPPPVQRGGIICENPTCSKIYMCQKCGFNQAVKSARLKRIRNGELCVRFVPGHGVSKGERVPLRFLRVRT